MIISVEDHTSLCSCGHSRGWHTATHRCGVDGCKCPAFEAACPDEAQTDDQKTLTTEIKS